MDGYEVVSYKYGLGDPVDWEIDGQYGVEPEMCFRMQNALWNSLVELWKATQAERERLLAASSEDVALYSERLTSLDAEIEAVVAEANRRRQKERTAKAKVSDLTERMRPLKAEQKQLREALKKAKSVASKAASAELASLRARFADGAKALRKQAVEGTLWIGNPRTQRLVGYKLWWSHATAVLDSFDVASKAILSKRSSGAPADMNFHPYDHSGRLVVQVQNGGVSVPELTGGAYPYAKIGPVLRVRGSGANATEIRTLTTTVHYHNGDNPRKVTFPLVMHRPLPDVVTDDGRRTTIQYINVFRRKVGLRFRWHAVVSCRVPAVAHPVLTGDPVAINIGWRRTPAGLRVATLLRDGEDVEHVYLRADLEAKHKKIAFARREASLKEEQIHRWAKELDNRFAPEGVGALLEKIARAPRVGGGILTALLDTWKQHDKWRPDDLSQLRGMMVEWRYQRTNCARAQWHLLNARRHHYQNEVKRIVGDASLVILNDHDMSETAKVKKGGVEYSDGTIPEAARANRVLAAPYEFRSALFNWARKTGAEIRLMTGPNAVCECHLRPFHTPAQRRDSCNPQNDRATLYWKCSVTGEPLDQDENYVCLMLASDGGDDPDTGLARKVEKEARPKASRMNRKRADKPAPVA